MSYCWMMRSVPATDMLTRLNQLRKLPAISSPTIRQRTALARLDGASSSRADPPKPFMRHPFRGNSLKNAVDGFAGQQRVRPAGLVVYLRVGRHAEQVIDGGGEVGRVVGRRGGVGG